MESTYLHCISAFDIEDVYSIRSIDTLSYGRSTGTCPIGNFAGCGPHFGVGSLDILGISPLYRGSLTAATTSARSCRQFS